MNIFEIEELKKLIDKLYDDSSSDTKDVRLKKQSLAISRSNDTLLPPNGKLLENPHRIVLASPEVIIGDVDKYGVAKGSGSVIIRANNISLESMGEITIRAPKIRTVAVNPGPDGEENSIDSISSISFQAQSIALNTDSTPGMDYFVGDAAGGGIGVISLSATNGISMTTDGTSQKESVDAAKKIAKSNSDEAKEIADKAKKQLEKMLEDILKPAPTNPLSLIAPMKIFDNLPDETDYDDEPKNQQEFEAKIDAIKAALDTYLRYTLRFKSEKCRAESLGKYEAPEKSSTFVSINANNVSVSGNGTEESSMLIDSPSISMFSSKAEGKQGRVHIGAEDIVLDAATNISKDDKTTVTPYGNVSILAKNLTVNSMETEYDKDGKATPKALAEGGTFSVVIENVKLSTNDHEGKGKGKVEVTSKETTFQAQDFDAEGKPTELTAEGKITATAKKIAVGGENKDEKTMSEEVLIEAKALKENAKESYDFALNEKDVTVGIKEKSIATKAETKIETETKDATLKAKTKIDGETEITKKLTADADIEGKGNAKISSNIEATNVKANSKVEAVNIEAKAQVKTPIVSK